MEHTNELSEIKDRMNIRHSGPVPEDFIFQQINLALLLAIAERLESLIEVQKPEVKEDILLSVGQAGRRLKKHNVTIIRWIKEGKLKASRKGKYFKILSSEVEKFVEL